MQRPLKEFGRRLCLSAASGQAATAIQIQEIHNEPQSGLPLLQVWPSDSPRRETDEQAFAFPKVEDNVDDSGIESTQVSPTPIYLEQQSTKVTACASLATTPQQSRRSSFLHPDRAKLYHLHHHHHHHQHHRRVNGSENDISRLGYISPDRASIGNVVGIEDEVIIPPSPTSSIASSLRSVPSSMAITSSLYSHERRRSSGRYSTFDPLELEYALVRAAARGSVGPYSFSESLHKLTFTQTLAFPALARNLATSSRTQSKNRRNNDPRRNTINENGESDFQLFVRIVTALVLVLASVMVFGVAYKFVKT